VRQRRSRENESMSDETRSRRSYWFWLAVALMVAPVLYILSVGPVVYVIERTGTGDDAARVVYAPLEWLAANTPLRGPLVSYIDLWEGMAVRKTPPAPPPPLPVPRPAPVPRLEPQHPLTPAGRRPAPRGDRGRAGQRCVGVGIRSITVMVKAFLDWLPLLVLPALPTCGGHLFVFLFLLRREGKEPCRRPEDVQVEDRPADRTGIKGEAPGRANGGIREGWRWKW
jgi:hypothetical protein